LNIHHKKKMPHCANREMSLGEQGLPNAIFTSSFIHHPPHFMIALANPTYNDSDTVLRDSAFFQSETSPQVVSEAKDNFCKDEGPASLDWHEAAAEKEQLQVDPQGAAMQRRQFGVPFGLNLNN